MDNRPRVRVRMELGGGGVRVLDLFSGIGGVSLGLERAGFETAAFCEVDPFCRSVLARHWPEVPLRDDIRRLDATALRGIDMVAGGPPCQAASVAGKRRGHEDERWLWDEYLRIVRDVRPAFLLAENVPGLVSLRPRGLDWILDELEAEGYACETVVVGADDAGAPHQRKRIWIVARAERRGWGDVADTPNRGHEGRHGAAEEARSADAIGDDAGELPRGSRGLCDVAHPERDTLRQLEQRVPGGRQGGVCDSGEAVAGESCEVADSHGRRRRSGRKPEPRGQQGTPGREPDGRGLGRTGAAPRWPAGLGQPQHTWEPPRTVERPGGMTEDLFAEEFGALPNGSLLNPDWVETLMGYPIGWTRSHCATRNDRLRALGNAVVPQIVDAIGRAIMAAERHTEAA